MKPDSSFAKLPWEKGIAQILERSERYLEPVLIVRGDDPEKAVALGLYLSSRHDTFYIRLGYATSMAYIFIELLQQLDPKFSIRIRRAIPHDKLIHLLCRKLNQLPFQPIIVLDKCHHIHFKHLFRIIRLINELEGKALFVFLLPEDYTHKWLGNQNENPYLNYFLKITPNRYQFYE